MNKDQFLRELRAALVGMPPEEIENAIQYYEEYFAEAGPEREQALLLELGGARAVAAQLRVDISLRNMEGDSLPSAKKGISTVWLVIVSIFAAPVALPIALVVALVAAALVFAVFGVVFAVFATAAALFVAGMLCVAVSAGFFATSISGGFFCVGTGLALTGTGLLMAVATVLCARLGFKGVAYLVNRVGNKKRGEKHE